MGAPHRTLVLSFTRRGKRCRADRLAPRRLDLLQPDRRCIRTGAVRARPNPKSKQCAHPGHRSRVTNAGGPGGGRLVRHGAARRSRRHPALGHPASPAPAPPGRRRSSSTACRANGTCGDIYPVSVALERQGSNSTLARFTTFLTYRGAWHPVQDGRLTPGEPGDASLHSDLEAPLSPPSAAQRSLTENEIATLLVPPGNPGHAGHQCQHGLQSLRGRRQGRTPGEGGPRRPSLTGRR